MNGLLHMGPIHIKLYAMIMHVLFKSLFLLIIYFQAIYIQSELIEIQYIKLFTIYNSLVQQNMLHLRKAIQDKVKFKNHLDITHMVEFQCEQCRKQLETNCTLISSRKPQSLSSPRAEILLSSLLSLFLL